LCYASEVNRLFWEDLAKDFEDPEFLREYITESVRIATVDAIINALDEARESANLSKADLARAIGAEPATVRRLFSASGTNPTLGTLAEVAAALGLRISVEPLPAKEREVVTRPLREGRATKAAARRLTSMRKSRRKPAVPA
jgi:transcriptional regulator with XRE-family HTH domain